jgi:Fe-S-cluster containining protein
MREKLIFTGKLKRLYVNAKSNHPEEAERFLESCETTIQAICCMMKKHSFDQKAALVTMYGELDRSIYPKWKKELSNRKLNMRCGKSSPCNQCCHIWVATFDSEIELIMELVNKSPELSRYLDWERIEKQIQVTDAEAFYALGPDISKCAFNSPEGLCLIHPIRPFSCRQYFVDESGAACGTPPESEELVNELVCLEGEFFMSAYIRLFIDPYKAEKNLSQQLMKYKPE